MEHELRERIVGASPAPRQARSTRARPIPIDALLHAPPQHCPDAGHLLELSRRRPGRASCWLPPSAWSDRKVGDGHRGRRGAADRLAAWAAASARPRRARWSGSTRRRSARVCQAESVLLELAAPPCPSARCVYTHFSPSAEPLARRLAGGRGGLPALRPARHRRPRCSTALAPDLLVFAKLDLWPELATRAAAARRDRGPGGRDREPGKRPPRLARAARCSAPGYACGRRPPARSPRPTRRGSPASACRRDADPCPGRSALRQRGGAGRGGAAGRPAARARRRRADPGGGVDLAARTRRVLLGAFARVRAPARPDARLILVPHEPTAEHLRGARSSRRRGWASRHRCGSARPTVPRRCWWWIGSACCATLYGAGTMAYVGGGFGRAGLHSVLEPAAWGVPGGLRAALAREPGRGLLLEAGAARGAADDRVSAAARAGGVWERMDDGRGAAASGAGRARAGDRGARTRARRGGRRRCWPGLFRHDPFEGDRARHDDAQRQHA